MKTSLVLGELHHHRVGALGRQTALELQREPHEVQADRLRGGACARLTGMLNRVRVYGEAVHGEE